MRIMDRSLHVRSLEHHVYKLHLRAYHPLSDEENKMNSIDRAAFTGNCHSSLVIIATFLFGFAGTRKLST